jgi:DNA-binding MurR/RpiR family transcriptional regulator
MTVGRYIKKLGYTDVRDLKEELRADERAWNVAGIPKDAYSQASLKAKIEALVGVYKLQQQPEWPRIVSLIAHAPCVQVASFQTGGFVGLGFATILRGLRPHVNYSDGSDGSYADILLDSNPGTCLVLYDVRRYSGHFRLLAEEAAARKIETVIVTDVHCEWARTLTELVLSIDAEFGLQSISMAQAVMELLLTSVADDLKGSRARAEEVHKLRAKFVGHIDADSDQRNKKTGK